MSRTVTAVKTSPHPTTSPNPARKRRQDRALSRQYRRQRTRGRRRWFRSLFVAGCIGSRFSLSLSVSVSLLFRSVNVRSRSLVSGNDLTQQTESSGRAEQSKGERRRERGEKGEEERHRLHLAASMLSASPFATSP